MPNSPLEGINFTNPTTPQETVRDQLFNWTIKHGKKIVIITEVIVLLAFISRFKLDHDTRQLVQRLEQNQSIAETTIKLENEIRETDKKAKALSKLISEQKDWGAIIDGFNSKIPGTEIRVERISFTTGGVNFSAIANSAPAFQKLASVFIIDESVESIILQTSQFNPEDKTYTFVLAVDFVGTSEPPSGEDENEENGKSL